MTERVVVVTGASSGIGAALSELMAHRGASVTLVARRADALGAVAAQCGTRARPIVADMTIRRDVTRVVSETLTHFGHIDVWVNNVGRGITRLPTQLTDDDLDQVLLDNVKTALYGMQEVLPHFKCRRHARAHLLVHARWHHEHARGRSAGGVRGASALYRPR